MAQGSIDHIAIAIQAMQTARGDKKPTPDASGAPNTPFQSVLETVQARNAGPVIGPPPPRPETPPSAEEEPFAVRRPVNREVLAPADRSLVRRPVREIVVSGPDAPDDPRPRRIAAQAELLRMDPRLLEVHLASAQPGSLDETGGIRQAPDTTLAEKTTPLGELSARFEASGAIGAIGYDKRGGTSYGMYQISSRSGSMDGFLDFLDHEAPEWAERLRAAGSADTGSRSGEMPDVFREIAAEDPTRFAGLQHEYVRKTHYEPTARAIRTLAGLDPEHLPHAVKEVIWSTAVQHGPSAAAQIFGEAAGMEQPEGAAEEGLIRAVYQERAKHFALASESVRDSVQRRLAAEQEHALSLLRGAAEPRSDDQAAS